MQLLKFIWKVSTMVLCGFFIKTKDNYDFNRFPHIEKNESIIKIFSNRIRFFYIWLSYTGCFLLNMLKFFKSYQLLGDEESKELFIRLIVYKILGWKHIKIKQDCGWSDINKLSLAVEQFYVSPSTITVKNHSHGDLNHYENIPVGSRKVNLDCWASSIIYALFKKQYYFARPGVNIKP